MENVFAAIQEQEFAGNINNGTPLGPDCVEPAVTVSNWPLHSCELLRVVGAPKEISG